MHAFDSSCCKIVGQNSWNWLWPKWDSSLRLWKAKRSDELKHYGAEGKNTLTCDAPLIPNQTTGSHLQLHSHAKVFHICHLSAGDYWGGERKIWDHHMQSTCFTTEPLVQRHVTNARAANVTGLNTMGLPRKFLNRLPLAIILLPSQQHLPFAPHIHSGSSCCPLDNHSYKHFLAHFSKLKSAINSGPPFCTEHWRA